MKKAIIVWGGYDAHQPKETAEIVAGILENDNFAVDLVDTLDVFEGLERMKAYDVIIPNWTLGEINNKQLLGLASAVKSGTGLAGWHGGAGDAFRQSSGYQYMIGGQFVAHPGGITGYTVNITNHNDPITAEIDDFKMNSEMYYMHVDPGNETLASIRFTGESDSWIDGVIMPAIWKRRYGKGKVFYCSLGHNAKDFEVPELREIIRRGIAWAAQT